MAATVIEIERLRRDLGLTADDLSDFAADEIFDEAAESYTGAKSRPAYARVLALQWLLGRSASQVDYSQDTTTEKASQYFSNLKGLLTYWEDKLAAAVEVETVAVSAFAGQSVRVPVVATW